MQLSLFVSTETVEPKMPLGITIVNLPLDPRDTEPVVPVVILAPFVPL